MEHGTLSATEGSGQGYPRAFGRYRLIAPIAMGGMAEVFLAEMLGPLGFRRRVAIKRILPHLAQNREFVRSFVDEARVGGLLVHPNIVQILDFSFVDKVPYLAMEYVEGGHLGHVLERMQRAHARMPASIIVGLLSQIGRGLEWAHRARDVDGTPILLIHRDLKPSNLLFGFDGHVKIADFGIAKASSNLTQTQPSMVKGSMPYMSPEQAMGVAPLTQSSDLFSLGAVAFECLTGERLYPPANTAMVLLGMVARGPSPERLALLHRLPDDHAALAPVVERLIAVQPEDRFPDAGAFVSALDRSGVAAASQEELAAFAVRWLSREEATTSRQFIVPSRPPGRGSVGPPPSDSPGDVPTPTRPGGSLDAETPAEPSGAPAVIPAEQPKTGESDSSASQGDTADGASPTGDVPGFQTSGSVSPPPAEPAQGSGGSEAHVSSEEARLEESGPAPDALVAEPRHADGPPDAPAEQTVSRFARARKPLLLAVLAALVAGGAGAAWYLTNTSQPSILTPVRDPSARAWLHVVSDPRGIRVSINDVDVGSPPYEVGLTTVQQPIQVRLVFRDGRSTVWEGKVAEGEHRVVDFSPDAPPETWVLDSAPWAREAVIPGSD